ncbi:MAG: hypothetical protein JWO14_2221 [Solirubrobacterales bacterium]|nr:hypothetical protein [Solirubrobacterales bacterium]
MEPFDEVFVDCELPSEVRDGMRHFESQIVHPPEHPLVGDVVTGIKVRPTGPAPDIRVQAQVTGEIALGEANLPFGILSELGLFVSGTLNWFAPLLREPEAAIGS